MCVDYETETSIHLENTFNKRKPSLIINIYTGEKMLKFANSQNISVESNCSALVRAPLNWQSETHELINNLKNELDNND